jgi:hypothetical protein
VAVVCALPAAVVTLARRQRCPVALPIKRAVRPSLRPAMRCPEQLFSPSPTIVDNIFF